jgi:hypothetical protein
MSAESQDVDHYEEWEKVYILYKNWRGETAWRQIIPRSIWFGWTEYHQDHQWLLKAYDCGKGSNRDFAMKDVLEWRTTPQEEKP